MHHRAAQPPGTDDALKVAFDERHGGALHRHIGPGAHRDPDLGLRQGGGVVDAIPRHPDETPLILQLLDRGRFLVRQHLGNNVIDAELAPDRIGGGTAVAG